MMLGDIFKEISLEGKISMITGAASGIGKGIAEVLGEAGSYLYLVDYNERELKKTSDELEKKGIKAEIFVHDLSSKEEIYKLWDELKDREPNILINNVGIYPFKDFLELDEKTLDKTIELNLKSTLWMCQKMIKANMEKKRGGVIVNVSSIEAILPFEEGLVHYTSSKAGVIALTRALAKEYGKHGFRVNVILPGGIKSESTKKAARDAILKMNFKLIFSGFNFWERIPSKKIGTPRDIGKAVLAIVSDLFSYVHGAVIPVDGGFLSA